ncbi:MAG: FHA domain-containing protein [Desulfosalsimonadaceae bacterium]
MPYIIVFRSDEKIMEYKVSENNRLRIGRSTENDIVLPDSAVSSVHAEIDYDGGNFYITDFQSRNGTFVNRELVISRPLAHDDFVSIGSHSLKFIYKEDEERPASFRRTPHDVTMHIDTPHHRSRLARSVAELGESGRRVRVRAMLTFLKKNSRPVFLDKPVVTIGSDPGADIVVKGWFAAKQIAEIKKKNEDYVLTPLGGRPPLVNSKTVRSETVLREFDLIQVGSTAMQFLYQRGVTDGASKDS